MLPNTLNRFNGRYWMLYLGGSADGYETDPLSTGVAWTDDPSSVREWTRYEGNPVLQPSESWDALYAHKPWVLKHDGVVYHWYCAVSRQGDREVRGIALAVSKPPA